MDACKRRKLLTRGQRAIAAAESWPLVGGAPGRGKPKSAEAADLGTFPMMARQWEVYETLRVRGIERVRLHADLTMLGRLSLRYR